VLTGLWALASRAAGFRFTPSEARKALWWQEQPVVQDLRPLAAARLADPDDRVRHAAIIAMGSLDYHIDQHPQIRLRPDTVAAFARAFREDQAVAVRAEAVKSLALAQSDPGLRDPVLVAALADPAPAVVQFAALGVAEHRLEAALPAVAALLGHSSRAVRLAAVQAFQSNPGAARTFEPALRVAVATEADPSIRATLAATLARVDW
jgi:HEAT repeat protein